jgi:hypothetical protein
MLKLKYTVHIFHSIQFICTLYDSRKNRCLIQILQNEIDESKNSKREKKGT